MAVAILTTGGGLTSSQKVCPRCYGNGWEIARLLASQLFQITVIPALNSSVRDLHNVIGNPGFASLKSSRQLDGCFDACVFVRVYLCVCVCVRT